MRDTMAHRGPDGYGLWRRSNLVLAHRRLAVVDLSPDAAQPMLSHDARYAIAYNGELYNDQELRAELHSRGVRFRTRSDTETLLHALATWGPDALPKLRGMFAFAFIDTLTQRLLLARDPLGIKPLYFRLGVHLGGGEIIFASEIPAILAHPDCPVQPDILAVSAYLTTIRTTAGNNTLFEGVRTLRAGEAMSIDLSGKKQGKAAAGDVGFELFSYWTGASRRATHAPDSFMLSLIHI